MHKIKLTALDSAGTPVTSNNCSDAVVFKNHKETVALTNFTPTSVHLTTNNGEYELLKHSSLNYYSGVCNNHRVQVTLKKMVGVLHYR